MFNVQKGIDIYAELRAEAEALEAQMKKLVDEDEDGEGITIPHAPVSTQFDHLPLSELEVMLKKEQNLASNRLIMDRLPDKGLKITQKIEQLKLAIQLKTLAAQDEKMASDLSSAFASSVQISPVSSKAKEEKPSSASKPKRQVQELDPKEAASIPEQHIPFSISQIIAASMSSDSASSSSSGKKPSLSAASSSSSSASSIRKIQKVRVVQPIHSSAAAFEEQGVSIDQEEDDGEEESVLDAHNYKARHEGEVDSDHEYEDDDDEESGERGGHDDEPKRRIHLGIHDEDEDDEEFKMEKLEDLDEDEFASLADDAVL